MEPFSRLENILRSVDRSFIGLICLSASLLSYWTGTLQALTSGVSLIFYLPVVAALTGILRLLIEHRLGKKKLSACGKAVFITGCDSGFGNALTKRLANLGYVVFAACLDETSEGARSLGGYSECVRKIQLDVTKDQDLETAEKYIKAYLESHNLRLWAVVANAGVIHGAPLELSPMTEVEDLMKVNLLGVIRTVKTFLPSIRKCKGRIIVTSSLSATFVFPYLLSYSVSKAAVKAFVQGLHRELQRFEVTCISIEPTFYRTPLLNFGGPTPTNRLLKAKDKIREDYSYFINQNESLMRGISQMADTNLEAPINAFEHAICSARPLRSYISAPLQYRILTYLSNHFDDHQGTQIASQKLVHFGKNIIILENLNDEEGQCKRNVTLSSKVFSDSSSYRLHHFRQLYRTMSQALEHAKHD